MGTQIHKFDEIPSIRTLKEMAAKEHPQLNKLRAILRDLESIPALHPSGKPDLNDLNDRRTPDLDLWNTQRTLRHLIRSLELNSWEVQLPRTGRHGQRH